VPFSSKKNIEIILKDVKIRENPSIRNAILIHINGIGKLKGRGYSVQDDYYGSRYYSQILLNDTPLVQINSPGCPTCSGMLATGYGIANANCEELQIVQEALNESFLSLEHSAATLSPLLSLLESGLYLLADVECYPTDGNGNFFWNVPNQLTETPTTAAALLIDSDYTYVAGQPVFLFPTQDSNCYDEKRVVHYENLLKTGKDIPRVIAYNFDEFISFVLDGHHKTCAAALLKKPVKSIVIIPHSGYSYQQSKGKIVPDTLCFSSIRIPTKDIPKAFFPEVPDWRKSNLRPKPPYNFHITAGTINHRNWEKEYYDAANFYPSVSDYARIVAAKIPCDIPVSNGLIEKCLADLSEENQQKMRAILLIMRQQNDERLKQTALSCAKRLSVCPLKEQACRILADIHGDSEIEQYFIDYLVDHSDRHDPILAIIDSFWE